MNPNGQWLGRTGQRWKLVPGVIALMIAGLSLVGLIYCSAKPEVAFVGLGNGDIVTIMALLVVLFGLFAFTWFMFAFRCPACGKSPSKTLISGENSSRWFSTLLVLEACPLCGDDASNPFNKLEQ